MGRVGSGVEVRPTSIRLAFTIDGETRRETLRLNGEPLAPTPANVKHAHRLAAEIRDRIRYGIFVYADYFPDSPRAKHEAPRTFGKLADAWLASKSDLAAATRSQYRLAAEVWKRVLGAETPLARLDHATLVSRIGAHPWASAKLHNNYLIVLRGILALEYHGRRAADSPLVGVSNRTVVKKLPDPLTAGERDRILVDLAAHYDPRIVAYFRWMFFTGMRPEEAIALRWSDIDEEAAVARVQRVRTFKGSERDGSKTHAERDVDLVPAALDALATMRAYTSMKGADPEVFENPVTRKPWHDERSQRDHYWHPSLKRLRIRARRPYCTRHTYCTVAMMGGVKPAYIAAQAGHSLKMLFDVYSRWLPGEDGGSERAALARAMSDSSPVPPRPSDASSKHAASDGRRDWTRTNARGRRSMP